MPAKPQGPSGVRERKLEIAKLGDLFLCPRASFCRRRWSLRGADSAKSTLATKTCATGRNPRGPAVFDDADPTGHAAYLTHRMGP